MLCLCMYVCVICLCEHMSVSLVVSVRNVSLCAYASGSVFLCNALFPDLNVSQTLIFTCIYCML